MFKIGIQNEDRLTLSDPLIRLPCLYLKSKASRCHPNVRA